MTDLSNSDNRLDFIRNFCKAADKADAEILKVAKESERLNHLYTEEKLDSDTADRLLSGDIIKTL